MIAPALDTPEGRAGFAAAMRPALLAILAVDALLLCAVGAASFALAKAALAPLVVAREREERFSADVAHELRTPLGAIASLAEAASAGDVRAAPVALDGIARRALECGELVADLLTLARASDAESLDCEPVDLAIVAQRVARERVNENASIVLDCTFESAIVVGDERRLRALVRNLLDNAYAHARSRIDLAVARRRVAERDSASRMTVPAWKPRCDRVSSNASRKDVRRREAVWVLPFAAGSRARMVAISNTPAARVSSRKFRRRKVAKAGSLVSQDFEPYCRYHR